MSREYSPLKITELHLTFPYPEAAYMSLQAVSSTDDGKEPELILVTKHELGVRLEEASEGSNRVEKIGASLRALILEINEYITHEEQETTNHDHSGRPAGLGTPL